MTKPVYQRVLLKLSGEALMGQNQFGIDPKVLDRIALEITEIIQLNVQVGIVIGGGNLFRGTALYEAGIGRITGDHRQPSPVRGAPALHAVTARPYR